MQARETHINLSQEDIILQAMWASIRNLNYQNAVMLSDTLISSNCYCEDVLYVRAYSNYCMGRMRVAHGILLMGATQVRSRLLLARCCLELELYSEGIAAIESILREIQDSQG